MPKALKRPHREVTPANLQRLKLTRQCWQLQTAKARFSEVFRLARTEGPQLITRQGKEGVVMMPVEQFDRMVIRSRQPNQRDGFLSPLPSRC